MRNPYSENIYRLLGIPLDSDQNTIYTAHKNMQIRLRAQASYNIKDPLESALKANRNEYALRNALTEINNPMARIQTRLFWFNHSLVFQDGNFNKIDIGSIEQDIDKPSNSIISYHILAVFYHASSVSILHSLLGTVHKKSDKLMEESMYKTLDDYLRKAFAYWNIIISSDDFWQYFISIELRSRFRVPASENDFSRLRGKSRQLVEQPVFTLMYDLLDNDVLRPLELGLNMLRSTPWEQENINVISYQASGLVYRSIERITAEIESKVNILARKGYISNESIKEFAIGIYGRYEIEIKPRLQLLVTFKDIEYRENKARELVAKCLRTVSLFLWEKYDEKDWVEDLLREAHNLSEDTFIQYRIEEDLETIRPIVSEYFKKQINNVCKGLIAEYNCYPDNLNSTLDST
ncbi:MAG: hypothetical protein GX974_03150, partial [Clostridiales bacterium]|nr:hypothetical protein [Clostridiales bacterium]